MGCVDVCSSVGTKWLVDCASVCLLMGIGMLS